MGEPHDVAGDAAPNDTAECATAATAGADAGSALPLCSPELSDSRFVRIWRRLAGSASHSMGSVLADASNEQVSVAWLSPALNTTSLRSLPPLSSAAIGGVPNTFFLRFGSE
eukprot:360121-Chlamydomonas_euryale.AAC.3